MLSPILMNLFMHYAFDSWMKRTYPQCPFARYADDAVVHCRTQTQAEAVMRSIALRLEECGLTMHPEKSKIVYCKDSKRTGAFPNVQFTFLGFTFRPRGARSRHNRLFTGFLPAVTGDALKRMRQVVRGWRLHRRTPATLEDLAQLCNRTIQGWWNYYGAFYGSEMRKLFHYIDQKLALWARRKYKTMRRRKKRSVQWSARCRSLLRGCSPTGVSLGARLGNGSRMRCEPHVRFCESLGAKFPGATHHQWPVTLKKEVSSCLRGT